MYTEHTTTATSTKAVLVTMTNVMHGEYTMLQVLSIQWIAVVKQCSNMNINNFANTAVNICFILECDLILGTSW